MNRVRRHTFETTLLAGICGLLLISCDQSSPPGSSAGAGATAPRPRCPTRSSWPKRRPIRTPIPALKKSARKATRWSCVWSSAGANGRFVDNRAIMTVVEGAMPNQCLSPDDACTTPWDYCCESPEALKENLAAVQINDAEGRPLEVDLEASPRLKPLATLVVRGTVGPRPDAQTLVINASGIYVDATP